ncbi:GlxA family transcriptional regulator [Ktedonobacter racemifer]|uniref:Transcriptional regulator, AraC family n=1 Tax=Ktedonobacter racemifer DSM 44963 TaxID=485913 RepID=D6TQU9_KTERA|nr:helix-turn-helix domain-containing protein [Ktedonobacter racemifer]EFH85820.1 transcriptional regulator, AraC family [Ktedonobacter racemifer DSM 44963]
MPQVQLLDLAGPVQVFDTAARLFGAPYTLLFCATSEEIRSAQHLSLARLQRLPDIDGRSLVIVPGTGASPSQSRNLLNEETKPWLQENYHAGAQVASICSGTAALGEAELLHRRRCTTHWKFLSELQSCYPTAQVVDGVLYVHDHGIITSAGVASGIDMALWLLEQDCGPRIAAEVARQLVIYFRRSGLHQQVSVYLQYRSHLDSCIHRVQDWLAEHVSEPATLADLASVGQTSERSLARAFKAATGITPHQYHLLLRLEVATQLVRETSLSLEAIATKSGFGDARQFRRVWHKHYGTPPSASR